MNSQPHPGRPTPFHPPALPLLVFTDLDGTLLDHDSYDYTPALPALSRLASLQVPLIPTTSKTLAEVSELQAKLRNPHPCIIENGGALCIPHGYFDHLAADPQAHTDTSPYQVLHLTPSYSRILHTLHSLRSLYHWQFTGFADMSVEQVVAQTGLSRVAAARARQRLCSEPMIWQDSDEALQSFEMQLERHGLSLTRGGRFWHVMGDTSKGVALSMLRDHYRQAGLTDITSVACGDSPNDIAMLEAADIAVVIRRPDGQHLDVQGATRTIVTDDAGPEGWNHAIEALLDSLATSTHSSTEA